MKRQFKVKRGDVFCSAFPGARLGWLIKVVETIRAKDWHAAYSHAGIIIHKDGETVESLWKVKSQNIYEAYKGCTVLIARYNALTQGKYYIGLRMLNKNIGKRYPIFRLPLHLLGLGRFIHWKKMVCSELVAKFLHCVGARHRHYFGVNPDDLADEFKNWKIYEVVFEGIIE